MKEFKAPHAHTVGSVLALFALVILALGIGALTYQSRVLHLEGTFWEMFAFVVAFAPTASTLVIAWYKLFAVSDEEHDKMLWIAFGLDMLSITMQLIGVGIVMSGADTHDAILLAVRIIAFAFSGLTLVSVALASGTSGYRKVKISEHQRIVDFQKTFNERFNEALQSDEIEKKMRNIANSMIDEEGRAMLSARARSRKPGASAPSNLYDELNEQTGMAPHPITSNGNKQHDPKA